MWKAIGLLLVSNIFMTFAWYGHLNYKHKTLLLAILASWGIAFFEYCLMVPANRIGHSAGLTTAHLKTIQEVVTMTVFVAFATFYMKEPIRPNMIVGFILIVAGAACVFEPWNRQSWPSIR